jgi:hypothetical protein
MSTQLNYPGLQAGDGSINLLKMALAQNGKRWNRVIRLLFRAEAQQNEFCLSAPGLKARVIHLCIYDFLIINLNS